MHLYVITGNTNKFLEVAEILDEVTQINLDLPEIQEIDPHKVIREKLLDALKHHKGALIVEDTSFFLDCLPGLPGPLFKWFEKTIGAQGVYEIAKRFNSFGASAKSCVGLAKSEDEIFFFEGEIRGKVVPPTKGEGFGFDFIFQPEGYTKTFAQLGRAEKNNFSHRRIALNKLKDFLDTEGQK
jgi:inosine triphosphate pyrophosphatase